MATRYSLDPLLEVARLLRHRWSLVAFAGILIFETTLLLWAAPEVVAETFDGIASNQLEFYQGPYLLSWAISLTSFSIVQLVLGRMLGTDLGSPPARYGLWGLLSAVSILGALAVVTAVDSALLLGPGPDPSFDFQHIESLAVAILDLAIFPLAVWQIAALQPGPRLGLREIWQKLRPRLILWLGNFVLLSALLYALGFVTIQFATSVLSGLPLLGYMLVNVPYAISLVAGVAFQIAAYRSVATHEQVADAFA